MIGADAGHLRLLPARGSWVVGRASGAGATRGPTAARHGVAASGKARGSPALAPSSAAGRGPPGSVAPARRHAPPTPRPSAPAGPARREAPTESSAEGVAPPPPRASDTRAPKGRGPTSRSGGGGAPSRSDLRPSPAHPAL